MSSCIICDKKHSKNIIFENDDLIIMLALEPAVNGHVQIFPKEHRTIFEHLEDEILSKIIDAANKVSMILFEVLKIHGTNIIINNGVPAGQKIPHFSIDIIPRRNDDGLKLDWELKQASEDSLNSMHRIISESIVSVPKNSKNENVAPKPVIEKPVETKIIETPNTKSQDKIIDVESKEIKPSKESLSEEQNNISKENTDISDDKPKPKKYNYYHKYFERTP